MYPTRVVDTGKVPGRESGHAMGRAPVPAKRTAPGAREDPAEMPPGRAELVKHWSNQCLVHPMCRTRADRGQRRLPAVQEGTLCAWAWAGATLRADGRGSANCGSERRGGNPHRRAHENTRTHTVAGTHSQRVRAHTRTRAERANWAFVSHFLTSPTGLPCDVLMESIDLLGGSLQTRTTKHAHTLARTHARAHATCRRLTKSSTVT